MTYSTRTVAALFALMLLPASTAVAQFGGSRAGVEGPSPLIGNLPPLARDVVESHIAIEGRAELRIPSTELRIVLAVTAEAETAQVCQQSIDATVEALKAAWSKMKTPPTSVVVDFIAVLPRYEWTVEKRGEVEVGVEQKVGYRMQTNLHVAVPSDAVAHTALNVAFEQGVTDIIAFDYWSQELDAAKIKAQEQALQAARKKADLLLGALFDEKLPAINVQEQTTLHFPESLYQSFTNVHDAAITPPFRRDIPFLAAHRPRNTYYRGLLSNGDIQPRDLPMKPEISVVSTVRLYYESPAANREDKEQKEPSVARN